MKYIEIKRGEWALLNCGDKRMQVISTQSDSFMPSITIREAKWSIYINWCVIGEISHIIHQHNGPIKYKKTRIPGTLICKVNMTILLFISRLPRWQIKWSLLTLTFESHKTLALKFTVQCFAICWVFKLMDPLVKPWLYFILTQISEATCPINTDPCMCCGGVWWWVSEICSFSD